MNRKLITRVFLAALIAFLVPGGGDVWAQGIPPDRPSEAGEGKPPLNGNRIVGQVFGGLGASVVGFWVGAIGAIAVGAGVWPSIFVGYCGGFSFGSSAGVYLVGKTDEVTASYWATLAGSAIGSGLGISALLVTESQGATYPMFFLPTVGAMIGFNLTREYRAPHESRSALVHIEGGRIRLSVPSVHLHFGGSDGRHPLWKLSLVQARF